MVDLNNEIFDSLEDERRAHFLNPAIICGLGDFGTAIINRLSERLAVIPALNYHGLLFFLEFHGQRHRVGTRLSTSFTNGKATINLYDQQATRAGMSAALKDNKETISKLWQRLVGKLLDTAGRLSLVDATKVSLFFVGDSQELDGSVGGVDLPILARESLSGFIANLRLQFSGLFTLPKGLSDKGAEVYAFLQDLSRLSSSPDSRLSTLNSIYDRCFLVSATNSSGVLDATAMRDLVAEFLFLNLTENKGALDQLFQNESSVLATFGLSSLVYPAEELVNFEAGRFAAGLIESEILKKEENLFERAAAEFIDDERMTVGGLQNRLMSYGGESTLLAEIDFDPLYFSQVEMKHWPDRIASYDAFLETEKTRELLGRLEQNLVQTYARARSIIRQKVDDLLSTEPAIDTAKRYITEVKRQLAAAHANALRRQDEILRSLLPLNKCHDQLVHHIQNLPSLSALASRLLIFGALSLYLTLRILSLMRRIPPKYFNVDFLPSNAAAGSAVIAITIIIGWLIYKRAEAKLFRSRATYLQAVLDRHKYIINWWIHRGVSWLLGDANAPELVERHLGSLIGLVDEEIEALDRLRREYLRALNEFKQSVINFSQTRVRRPITEALGVTLNIKYKRGQFSLAEEATMFVAGGGHADWRRLSKKQLQERLLNFVAQGFKFVQLSGAQRIIAELGAAGGDVAQALSELEIFSQPYLALTPALPETIKMLATASPHNLSWLGGRDIGSATVINSPDFNSIYYLQIARIKMENLTSLTLWRQDYEETVDKSPLHCVDYYWLEPPQEAMGGG